MKPFNVTLPIDLEAGAEEILLDDEGNPISLIDDSRVSNTCKIRWRVYDGNGYPIPLIRAVRAVDHNAGTYRWKILGDDVEDFGVGEHRQELLFIWKDKTVKLEGTLTLTPAENQD